MNAVSSQKSCGLRMNHLVLAQLLLIFSSKDDFFAKEFQHVQHDSMSFVLLLFYSQGILEENDIHHNRIAGIEVKNEANPIIFNCSIHHGSTGGVYVHDKVGAIHMFQAVTKSRSLCCM